MTWEVSRHPYYIKIAHWADEFSKDALGGKCRSSKSKSAGLSLSIDRDTWSICI